MLNIKKLFTKLMGTESVTPQKVGTKWTSGSITCYRTGGLVTLKFGGTSIEGISSRTQIAIIPEGFRPVTQIVLTTYGGLDVVVNTNGSLQVDPPAGGTYYGNIAYGANLGGGYFLTRFMSTFSHLAERWWDYVEYEESTDEIALDVCYRNILQYSGNAICWNTRNLCVLAITEHIKSRIYTYWCDKCGVWSPRELPRDCIFKWFNALYCLLSCDDIFLRDSSTKHECKSIIQKKLATISERGWACA